MLYAAGGLLVLGGCVLAMMVHRRKSTATEHQALVLRGGGNMPSRGYENPSYAPNANEADEAAMGQQQQQPQNGAALAPARKKKQKQKKSTQPQIPQEQGQQWRSSVRGPHNQPPSSTDQGRVATQQGRKVYILDPYVTFDIIVGPISLSNFAFYAQQ